MMIANKGLVRWYKDRLIILKEEIVKHEDITNHMREEIGRIKERIVFNS